MIQGRMYLHAVLRGIMYKVHLIVFKQIHVTLVDMKVNDSATLATF